MPRPIGRGSPNRNRGPYSARNRGHRPARAHAVLNNLTAGEYRKLRDLLRDDYELQIPSRRSDPTPSSPPEEKSDPLWQTVAKTGQPLTVQNDVATRAGTLVFPEEFDGGVSS